ncbi:hypothetical protein CAPTEDRAFT_204981 [Capitella teleta]|uniref:DUF1308 domain-containing protein n=1 Tax=Capitella teleta TaxID=283909 RepID=R7USG9_CAPTE|nr:hypothetical protein CAPTEDRAFT_204981 [Capitella teleta]|eukprot:ELU06361.1 hypothetical protein CAPTEDRAFT_204981 [Capitella teleta]
MPRRAGEGSCVLAVVLSCAMPSKQPWRLEESHLASSNLTHIQGIVEAAETLPNVVLILHTFCSRDQPHPIVVDVVCNHGYTWVKVIARKPEALHLVYSGQGQFGDRSITEQAERYVTCAKEFPLNFTSPQVTFLFARGVTRLLKQTLLDAGISVEGSVFELTESSTVSHVDEEEIPSASEWMKSQALASPMQKVNLDVTALIALISNLCHGRCHFVFQEAVLTSQAEEERIKPVLPDMQNFLKGKEMLVCQSALESLQSILATVGGPTETQRASDLLRRVIVVDDAPSPKANDLKKSAKINHRAQIIFGTGDTLQAVTLSANAGFIRAAANQGVHFAAYVHAARALTEQKEHTAKAIDVLKS